MYYLMMKTLVKPQVNPTIAISSNYLYKNNKSKVQQLRNRRISVRLNFLLFVFSLFIFLLFPESPQQSANICDKYYSEKVCNIW